MTDNVKKVAERLRGLAADSGKKAKEIAFESGVPAANISRYLNGKRIPKGNYLVSLSRFFGVSPDWLLTGEGPSQSEQKYGEEQKLKQNLASPELAGVGGMINTQLLEGIGMYILGDLVHDIMRDGSDDQRARLKRAGRTFLRTALAIAEEMDSASEDQEKKQSQTGA